MNISHKTVTFRKQCKYWILCSRQWIHFQLHNSKYILTSLGVHSFRLCTCYIWLLHFVRCCFCSVVLLLLRSACSFRYSRVYRLQSVGQTQSEAVKYQTEAPNITTASGCSRGTKGCVQWHAERVDWRSITSPADLE